MALIMLQHPHLAEPSLSLVKLDGLQKNPNFNNIDEAAKISSKLGSNSMVGTAWSWNNSWENHANVAVGGFVRTFRRTVLGEPPGIFEVEGILLCGR